MTEKGTYNNTNNAVSGPILPLASKVELQNILNVGLETKPNDIALFTSSSSSNNKEEDEYTHQLWTFNKLHEVSDNVARSYIKLGAKSGDRIASLLPNCPELIVHYIACFKVGLVLVPMNYRYTPSEIDHALQLSGSSILVSVVDREEDLKQLTVKTTLGIVSLGGGGTMDFLANFESLMKEEEGGDGTIKSLQYPETEGGASTIIFFTSGSTGKPKGVTHTYTTYGYCLSSMIQALNITKTDVVMPASSCSHAAGFLYSLAALTVGAPVVVAANGTADVVLPLLRMARPTICFFLPSFLLMLIRDARAQREDFVSVRHMQSGGDKVASLLQKEFHKLTGLYISEIMGMSEAAPITIHRENEPGEKRGSIGRPAPGILIRIRDVATKDEVPLGEDGRMWIKGPLVMSGYWDNSKATSDTFDNDMWMDTGDVVHADEDGYIWFAGRQKQIIVHDGSNISPLEVEDVLMGHAAVDQAGVVGVADIIHGENVHAFVTLKDGMRVSEAELITHARQQIGYKAPEKIQFLASMPLNPTGKMDRAALKNKDGDADNDMTLPPMVQKMARLWMRNVLMRRASAQSRRRSSMVEMEQISPEILQLLEVEDEAEMDE
mmetsp:Transcript_15531/g.37233  ORF Transcript_15531/g.37233 Transcript_15531/m.37233 type:complete len:608 (+) Transcript_15531:94-1917(+)